MMQICREDKCTGCGFCAAICNKIAIHMQKDHEGFYIPNVDLEKCVKCGKCIRLCPSNQEHKFTWQESQFWAARNKNAQDKIFSSSGGMFKALADYVLEHNGYVFGVSFDLDFMGVTYNRSDKVGISELQKSKYLESKISDLYEQIELCLDTGNLVLVCGTPCHIQGLRSKFGHHEQLFLVDFLCHGVVSSSVFAKYIENIEKKFKSKVCRVYFRDKKYGWDNSCFMRILFGNGKEYNKLSVDDPYYRLYFYGLAYRKSCYTCNRCLYSSADITIGDFWGAGNCKTLFKDNKGISLVGIHGSRGKELFGYALEGLETETLVLENVAYAFKERNLPIPETREEIIHSIVNGDVDFFSRRNMWGNKYIDFVKEILIKFGVLSFINKVWREVVNGIAKKK